MMSDEAKAAAAERLRSSADRLLDAMGDREAHTTAAALKNIAAETAAVAEAQHEAAGHLALHRAGAEAQRALKRLERRIEHEETRLAWR